MCLGLQLGGFFFVLMKLCGHSIRILNQFWKKKWKELFKFRILKLYYKLHQPLLKKINGKYVEAGISIPLKI